MGGQRKLSRGEREKHTGRLAGRSLPHGASRKKVHWAGGEYRVWRVPRGWQRSRRTPQYRTDPQLGASLVAVPGSHSYSEPRFRSVPYRSYSRDGGEIAGWSKISHSRSPHRGCNASGRISSPHPDVSTVLFG